MMSWLRRWWGHDYVSPELLNAYLLEESKQGWDGPRWRTPKERAQMERADRRRALTVVSHTRRYRKG